MAGSLTGMTTGPMLAVFTLGICFPCANTKVIRFFNFKRALYTSINFFFYLPYRLKKKFAEINRQ